MVKWKNILVGLGVIITSMAFQLHANDEPTITIPLSSLTAHEAQSLHDLEAGSRVYIQDRDETFVVESNEIAQKSFDTALGQKVVQFLHRKVVLVSESSFLGFKTIITSVFENDYNGAPMYGEQATEIAKYDPALIKQYFIPKFTPETTQSSRFCATSFFTNALAGCATVATLAALWHLNT